MSKSKLQPLKLDISRRLDDPAFRDRFIRTWASTEIAGELRRMRRRRVMTQTKLAKLVGTKQSAISRVEDADYGGWTVATLVDLACALRARVRITLEPIEDVQAAHRAQEPS